MPFPIAVTTGTLYPASTLESIAALRSIGVRDIELTLQANEFRLGFDRELCFPILPALLKAVDTGELKVRSVHGPLMPVEHAAGLRDRLAYLRHSLETAALLGAGTLVVHPFHLALTTETAAALIRGDIQEPGTALLPGIDEIFDRAEQAGIRLAIENIQLFADEPFFNTGENLGRFLMAVGHPALGVTLDLYHAAALGSLDGFLELLPGRIASIHAADFTPPLQRVSPGQGELDWERLSIAFHRMPGLRQVCLELYNPPLLELSQAVRFLQDLPNPSLSG